MVGHIEHTAMVSSYTAFKKKDAEADRCFDAQEQLQLRQKAAEHLGKALELGKLFNLGQEQLEEMYQQHSRDRSL